MCRSGLGRHPGRDLDDLVGPVEPDADEPPGGDLRRVVEGSNAGPLQIVAVNIAVGPHAKDARPNPQGFEVVEPLPADRRLVRSHVLQEGSPDLRVGVDSNCRALGLDRVQRTLYSA